MTSLASKLKAVGVGAVVAVAIYVSGLLSMLTPLPVLYVSVSRGRKAGLATALVATAFVAAAYLFLFPMFEGRSVGGLTLPAPGAGLTAYFSTRFLAMAGTGYFAFFAAVALALAEGVHRRWGVTRWGATAVLAGLLVLAAIGVAASSAGTSVTLSSVQSYVQGMVDQVVKMNEAAGPDSAAISALADNGGQVAAFIVGIAPSIVFVFVMLTVALNMMIGRRMIRGHHAFAHVHNMARFRLPDATVWAVIACGAAFFVDHYVRSLGVGEAVAINGLVAMAGLYFFQGMAVVVYLLQGVKAPLIRTFAYVLIALFFQTVSVMIVAVGVADVWADFRLRSWRARHMHNDTNNDGR